MIFNLLTICTVRTTFHKTFSFKWLQNMICHTDAAARNLLWASATGSVCGYLLVSGKRCYFSLSYIFLRHFAGSRCYSRIILRSFSWPHSCGNTELIFHQIQQHRSTPSKIENTSHLQDPIPIKQIWSDGF